MKNKGVLYLIPTLLSETASIDNIPQHNVKIINEIKYFVVENIKTARRFLKKINNTINFEELDMRELNEHTPEEEVKELMLPLFAGCDVGLLSEVGCPAVADPGAVLVRNAHANGIKVVPLIGPSSIILSLMASGLNAQSFTFVGYLPVDKKNRIMKIKQIQNNIRQYQQSHIVIETPYRNKVILKDIIDNCFAQLKLCVAVDITGVNEFIYTASISEWKKLNYNIPKLPAIFILGL